jgi:hypothetical protein
MMNFIFFKVVLVFVKMVNGQSLDDFIKRKNVNWTHCPKLYTM